MVKKLRKSDKRISHLVYRLTIAIDKSEIRISGEASRRDQSETNPNFQNSNFLNFYLFRTFGIWSFKIVSNFGFRASNLELLAKETISKRPCI